MAKPQGHAFHRRCQITGSRISQGRAKSQGRRAFHRVAHFTGSREITGSSRISQGCAKSQGRRAFHRVAPNHRVVAHFTGSRQITGSRISQHSIISRKVCRSQHGAISILHFKHSLYTSYTLFIDFIFRFQFFWKPFFFSNFLF